MNLAKHLKTLREAQGLSQAELEKKTGIKREYISKMEGGGLSNPTINTMTKLAKGLGFADAAIFLTNDPQVLAAIVSATCKARSEAGTAKHFQALCGLVAEVSRQLEEMGRGK